MPRRQPKAAIERRERDLLRAYARVWQRVEQLQESIAEDPARWRQRRKLDEARRAIDRELDALDARAQSWFSNEFPQIHAMGVNAGASEIGVSAATAWANIPTDAVATMASEGFGDLLKSTRTVRRTTKAMIRSVLEDEIMDKLIRGDTAEAAARRARRIIERRGVYSVKYKDGSVHGLREYANMAVRTKTAVAYNLGALDAQTSQGIQHWEIMDGVGCVWPTGHGAGIPAQGQVVTRDDALMYPIAHPNCVAAGTEVEPVGQLQGAYRATYSGLMIEVRTAAGARLTVTPNHPVFTGRGWVPAGELREGDEVLSRALEAPPGASLRGHLHDVPPRVEEVFDACWAARPGRRTVATPEDFHGDGAGLKGQIDVVGAEGLLAYDAQATGEQREQRILLPTGAERARFAGSGALVASSGGIDLVTPSSVGLGHIGRVAATWADRNPLLTQTITDDAVATSELGRELSRGLSREVATDEVIEIRYREAWSGHVFDLSTSVGAYVAGGIVVHNCRRAFAARPDLDPAPYLREIQTPDVRVPTEELRERARKRTEERVNKRAQR